MLDVLTSSPLICSSIESTQRRAGTWRRCAEQRVRHRRARRLRNTWRWRWLEHCHRRGWATQTPQEPDEYSRLHFWYSLVHSACWALVSRFWSHIRYRPLLQSLSYVLIHQQTGRRKRVSRVPKWKRRAIGLSPLPADTLLPLPSAISPLVDPPHWLPAYQFYAQFYTVDTSTCMQPVCLSN